MAAQISSDIVYVTNSQPPQATIMIAKPVSYEFRVVEHIDDNNKIIGVKLQYQVLEHDQYGYGTVTQYWQDVQRVKMKDGIIYE